jgi:intraflagellar transport protein 122
VVAGAAVALPARGVTAAPRLCGTPAQVPHRILSASWTSDGVFMAMGLINGDITIRDKSGAEKAHIERGAPVWALCWCPSKDDTADILAVGCWDQTLSFYSISGAQIGRDRPLGYDPCSLSCMNEGEYVLVGGSDKGVTLFTKDGVKLHSVCSKEDWVWACKARGKAPFVAVGGNDGKVSLHKVIVNSVSGVYGDRYAYRDSMTDVVVQHLTTEQKVRIKCRDYIKKIGVYKNRLVVQLPDRILIYEVGSEDAADMHYRLREKIVQSGECNLLAVTALHVLITVEQKLLLRNFAGRVEREWVFDSPVRCLRVIGGPAGAEGVLIGLKSGQVVKIFMNNPFPITLIKQAAPVIALDLSASRDKLAVVDADNRLLVYDLRSGELLFTVRAAAAARACGVCAWLWLWVWLWVCLRAWRHACTRCTAVGVAVSGGTCRRGCCCVCVCLCLCLCDCARGMCDAVYAWTHTCAWRNCGRWCAAGDGRDLRRLERRL